MGSGGGAFCGADLGRARSTCLIFGTAVGTENDTGALARTRCFGGGASFISRIRPTVRNTPKSEKNGGNKRLILSPKACIFFVCHDTNILGACQPTLVDHIDELFCGSALISDDQHGAF